MIKKRGIILVFLACLLTSCYFPKDPRNTLEKILKTKIIKVAAILNPPWVDADETGVEISLLKKFAKELNARPVFIYLPEQNAMWALQDNLVDIVVGGITQSTPWKKIGKTRSFYTEKFYIGLPEKPKEQSRKVAIATASWLIPYVLDKEYLPTEVKKPFLTNLIVAAPEWQLKQYHYKLLEELSALKHIMAVPQGENRFLVTLETFLGKKKKFINNELSRRKIETNTSI